jgi:hypothetical protein
MPLRRARGRCTTERQHLLTRTGLLFPHFHRPVGEPLARVFARSPTRSFIKTTLITRMNVRSRAKHANNSLAAWTHCRSVFFCFVGIICCENKIDCVSVSAALASHLAVVHSFACMSHSCFIDFRILVVTKSCAWHAPSTFHVAPCARQTGTSINRSSLPCFVSFIWV